MSPPQVSVLMPAYNAAAFLAAAIDSALSQTFRDFELLVVDDGSTDATGAIAERYANDHPEHVRVIHQANGGLVAARNTAIAHARGQLLALLDADDVWRPHHLARCVERLQRDPDIGLVHANIMRIDADGAPLGVPPRFWDRFAGREWEAIYLRQEHVSCPTAVFRLNLVQRVGGFDALFNRLGCEDRDLWLRLAAVSRVVYLDDVHADYRLHASNMSKVHDRMLQARLRLIDKHGATPQGAGLRRRALAALRCDMGDDRRASGDFLGAGREFVRAIRHTPTGLRPFKGLVNAALRRR